MDGAAETEVTVGATCQGHVRPFAQVTQCKQTSNCREMTLSGPDQDLLTPKGKKL